MDHEWGDAWDDGDDWGDLVDAMEARGRRRGRNRAAKVITLHGKRRFDFSFLAGSDSREVVIRRALPVIPYYYTMILVRVHQIDVQGGSFAYHVYNTLPSPQDPQEFTDPNFISLTITIDSTNAAGDLETNTDAQDGPFFKIALTATQGTTGQRLYAELSAALYCRAVG